MVDITLEGGSGKATVDSPVHITEKGGKLYATLVWSSKNYDYVIVDGIRYDNENTGGLSTFTVPVKNTVDPFTFIADTVAMSKPHEIEYTIKWNASDDSRNNNGEIGEYQGRFGKKSENTREFEPEGLKMTGEIPLRYAKGFEIKKYGDISLVSIFGANDLLIVPEGQEVPENVPDDMIIVRQPVDHTYVVSTSVMDLVRQCGGIDCVRFSSLREGDWDIDEANDRMRSGSILYAGKYRTPDYELILSEGCDLVIENTMIYHDPEVMEKLGELGIPVIVETSSYEEEPLGRLEWIKLYGLLFGHEKEAEEFFDKEAARIEALSEDEDAGKTVAFFSVSSTGLVNVRRPGDYITKLIGLAGGRYVPELDADKAESGSSSMNMQMEDFYASVKDADIIIYNSTIEDELDGIAALTGMSELFLDFKAVKEGNVYCLKKDFFQNTTKMADFIEDVNAAIHGWTDGMRFIYRLENDNE